MDGPVFLVSSLQEPAILAVASAVRTSRRDLPPGAGTGGGRMSSGPAPRVGSAGRGGTLSQRTAPPLVQKAAPNRQSPQSCAWGEGNYLDSAPPLTDFADSTNRRHPLLLPPLVPARPPGRDVETPTGTPRRGPREP